MMEIAGRFSHVLAPVAVMAAVAACLVLTLADRASAAAWEPPAVTAASLSRRPCLAATPDELARLRDAWKAGGAAREALADVFARVDAAIDDGVEIPPAGGQHNQWYQCDDCQRGLETVDAHHHRCPKCGTVYSGYPYDNVLYKTRHNKLGYRINEAGWAYAVTGDERYARFVAERLLAYARLYQQWPLQSAHVGKKDAPLTGAQRRVGGRIIPQTLSEAMWVTWTAPAYDLVRDSGVLTDDQRRTIERDLFAAMAEQIGGHKAGKSNWQTWHNAALLHAGAVIGDTALVNRAVRDPDNGFAHQMAVSVLPEGMWYENSWGYHYYTLLGMTRLTEGARRLGLDLYSHPRLERMFLVGFDYRLSNGQLPRFGDDTGRTPDHDVVNEIAYHAYRDDRLLSTLPSEPTFDSVLYGRDTDRKAEAPPMTSTLFPGAGHAILHTDGPGRLSAAVTFGPYGGFHGHFDKLSFVFTGYGAELGVDPGRARSQAYRLPIHRQWYKSTLGHNAVLVDGRDQQPAAGVLRGYAADAHYAAVAAGAGEAFDAAAHERFCLLTDRYLLVVDELAATDGKSHDYAWLYHNRSRRFVPYGLPVVRPLADVLDHPGTAYVGEVGSWDAPPGEAVRGCFLGEDVLVHLFNTVEGDRVGNWFSDGPAGSVDDRAALVLLAARGPRVRYATVLEPTPFGGKPTPRSVRITTEGGVLTVEVSGSDAPLRVVFPEGRVGAPFAVRKRDEDGTWDEVLKADALSP
ncbi:MAG: heparinase II/III domain-containing protein [Planctomycetota bacterium]